MDVRYKGSLIGAYALERDRDKQRIQAMAAEIRLLKATLRAAAIEQQRLKSKITAMGGKS